MTYEYKVIIKGTTCKIKTNFKIEKGRKLCAIFIKDNGCKELIFGTVIEVLEENIF